MIFTTRDLDILRFLRWCRFVLAEDLTGVFSKGEVQNLEILRLIKLYQPAQAYTLTASGTRLLEAAFPKLPAAVAPAYKAADTIRRIRQAKVMTTAYQAGVPVFTTDVSALCEQAMFLPMIARNRGSNPWGSTRVAALLHDCTKKLEMPEQLALCRQYGIELDELEQKALKLLHAKTGAALARDVFGVDDEIYNAILWHTTGKPDMTVLENLKIGAYLRKDDLSEDLEWVYSLFPRLKERSWQAGGTLSGGEQQMLAVGRALMSRPKLLMMDEPSLGLAPLVVRDIFSIIQEINKQGVTILLIEQNANMALKIADIGYVLETGRITLTGSGEELLTNDAVRAAYLGA